MAIVSGADVRHADYGLGRVIEVLGQQAVVDFFGDSLTVEARTLQIEEAPDPVPVAEPRSRDKALFRQAYEAVNLGVVPPHPDQLLSLSIGGDLIAQRTRDWLAAAPEKGLCKVIFGDYGLGKSHHLRTIEACALRQGWVVSFLELDPKQVDPAKPHLLYRALTAALRFPIRGDGSQVKGFFDLVGEVRQYWHNIAPGRCFRGSEWFEPTMTVLRAHSHVDRQHYREGVDWLSGQITHHVAIRRLAAGMGARVRVPRAMPKIRETADVYVQHLVVINEWCRSLGYKGLLILLDEAEHVKGFSVRRRDRATNLFDLLACCARPPSDCDRAPIGNDHGFWLPKYWREGPHFALVVALTEGNTFSDSSLDLRDACVFLRDKSDFLRLEPPTKDEYYRWCLGFLEEFERHYPGETAILRGGPGPRRFAGILSEEFERQPHAEQPVRLWTKMASFVASLLLARAVRTGDELEGRLRSVARTAAGEITPWEVEA